MGPFQLLMHYNEGGGEKREPNIGQGAMGQRLICIHKVRLYKEYHSVCPLVGIGLGLSHPLSRQRASKA